MRILFFHASAFNKAQFCELMDEAERLFRDGNEVYFAPCNGILNSCCANECSNAGDCVACKLSMNKSLKMLSKGIKIVHLNPYRPADVSRNWEYSNAKQLKDIHYNGVELGYSVMSFYISLTRNLNPLIDNTTKPFFDNLLTQGAILADTISSVIDDLHPEKICVFNGRMFDAKPAMQVALKKGVKVDVYEIFSKYPYYKVVFEDHLPHDIEYTTQLIEKFWDNSKKTIEEKRAIGKSFFEKRAKGIPAGDKVYINGQQEGLLPSDWDSNRHNIVIFNSSEDEYASIGDEYDKYRFFESQIEGIQEILEMTKSYPNIHFYLRVHPNLTNIKYRYHTDLYEFSKKYSNITVIPANEKVSTYAIMRAAEKVIVFGSTMGIESAYWGKPVILLAGANYYLLGACHIPTDKQDLLNMIISPLSPKEVSPDVYYKVGFYTLDAEKAITPSSFSFFDFNVFTMKCFGKTFHGTNCQKLFGSKKMYAFTFAILRQILKSLNHNQYTVPLKEEV